MNSKRWKRIHCLEDALALIADADDARRAIRTQAWHEGDWGAVFELATRQAAPLRELRACLADRWQEMMEGRND